MTFRVELHYYTGIRNFGDELSPYLISKITSRKVSLASSEPENRGIYTQSDSSKKSSRNIWSLAVVSVDQRY